MADIETSADQGAPHTRVISPNANLTWPDPGGPWRHRAFLHIPVWRDLKVRYKQTVAGLAWALFEPLVMTVVVSIFLGYLVRVPSDDSPYPVFFLAWLTERVTQGS